MTTVEQDTIHQYLDGRDLLNATLTLRGQLLQRLEQMAKDSQETRGSTQVAVFPVISAQALLFELSIISENIDSLIWEINCYAQRCGKPRIEFIRQPPMICPRCSSKATLILASASKQSLPSREPKVFAQYRCEQGHYFVTLKTFDGMIYQEQYLASNDPNPEIRASKN